MTPPSAAPRRARALAGATAALTVAYLTAYVLVVRSQDGSGVAWWYVALLLVAAAAAGTAAATRRAQRVMPACAVLLGACALVGLLSVGVLLLPAVLTAVLSASATRGPRPAQAPGR